MEKYFFWNNRNVLFRSHTCEENNPEFFPKEDAKYGTISPIQQQYNTHEHILSYTIDITRHDMGYHRKSS